MSGEAERAGSAFGVPDSPSPWGRMGCRPGFSAHLALDDGVDLQDFGSPASSIRTSAKMGIKRAP